MKFRSLIFSRRTSAWTGTADAVTSRASAATIVRVFMAGPSEVAASVDVAGVARRALGDARMRRLGVAKAAPGPPLQEGLAATGVRAAVGVAVSARARQDVRRVPGLGEAARHGPGPATGPVRTLPFAPDLHLIARHVDRLLEVEDVGRAVAVVADRALMGGVGVIRLPPRVELRLGGPGHLLVPLAERRPGVAGDAAVLIAREVFGGDVHHVGGHGDACRRRAVVAGQAERDEVGLDAVRGAGRRARVPRDRDRP